MTPPLSILTNSININNNNIKFNIKTIFERFKTSLNALKSFPIRYYALTIVGSAVLSGISSSILQKNINVNELVQKFDHIAPKSMLVAPTPPK